MRLDLAVCLPQDAASVALIRKVATGALDIVGVTEQCVGDIRLALSEACTNVVQHAAAEDEYEVQLQVDDTQCAITVKNTGNGFDADALADEMPDVTSARGRGVAIMRAVMDAVEFTSQPETGTIVHLVKTLSFRDGSPLGPGSTTAP